MARQRSIFNTTMGAMAKEAVERADNQMILEAAISDDLASLGITEDDEISDYESEEIAGEPSDDAMKKVLKLVNDMDDDEIDDDLDGDLNDDDLYDEDDDDDY